MPDIQSGSDHQDFGTSPASAGGADHQYAGAGQGAGKHTPGPWTIRGVSIEDGSISIGSAELRIIIAYATNAASIGHIIARSIRRGEGRLSGSTYDDPQYANARLIAAAPDLLEALIATCKLADDNLPGFDGRTPECQAVYDQCMRAIAKATGEGPR
jgi:hypothetical protein